ncbi:carbohydrate kinase [Mucilaginibacter roseus]|uniref:Carbohydrate kinase n=1 Tax=Mucilaginibacter roseus TaxID=1528868 RepID=A0ABS8TWJ9_9SPHI|nr:FGGY family carbohydrate kinase [Mucilaginibacter roseus]MCD8739258.1 carbohydrate kinase [Mucilaginibacter roseus]
MSAQPVIAIFDIGKTNKKLLLFNERYEVVFEHAERLEEITDEDGYPCEDLKKLRHFISDNLTKVLNADAYNVKAINFTAYGASFVYIDQNGNTLTPLYNYLKPYPYKLRDRFYESHGTPETIAIETASPALGNLNSGMQLYSLKYQQPQVFNKVKAALHLPQYLSFLLSGEAISELTSVGCHTTLWDFTANDYHRWVYEEELNNLLPPLKPGDDVTVVKFNGQHNIMVGNGLHDSSSALIPYLVSFAEPFILLSTGTWSITLNPFDQTPLTVEQLENDCLNYIQYKGTPVKASRYFAGPEYEQRLAQIAAHFNQSVKKYERLDFDHAIAAKVQKEHPPLQGSFKWSSKTKEIANLDQFTNDVEAYYWLIMDIVAKQKSSTELVLNGTPVKCLFVDGGFSKNKIFMHLLAAAFPHLQVCAATMPQATAIGAGLAIHHAWNNNPYPADLINLEPYS